MLCTSACSMGTAAVGRWRGLRQPEMRRLSRQRAASGKGDNEPWVAPSLIVVVHFRVEPVESCYDGIGHQEHVPLQPCCLAIGDYGEREHCCEDEHHGVHGPEVQVHVLINGPADEDGKRHHQERNLGRRAHGDADGDVQLLGHGHAHSSRVLTGVADHGQQHDADEGPTHPALLREAIDGLHQEFRAEGHDHGCDREQY
mmetsp:Transcript_148246/g.412865  ORF Transcript_148246/g.412865 Transcript_148246/m.412865 type:complete len:200 (-) Transcript_148246:229-828(-)